MKQILELVWQQRLLNGIYETKCAHIFRINTNRTADFIQQEMTLNDNDNKTIRNEAKRLFIIRTILVVLLIVMLSLLFLLTFI